MRLLLLLALLAACGSKGAPPAKPPPSPNAPRAAAQHDAGPIPTVTGARRLIENSYFVEEGGPDPIACRADKDCIGDTVTDETGCCVRSPEPRPQTWAWHRWISERRLSHTCDDVTCPPLPIPSMPETCKLDARCKAGRCADSCSDQPQDKQQKREGETPKKQQ